MTDRKPKYPATEWLQDRVGCCHIKTPPISWYPMDAGCTKTQCVRCRAVFTDHATLVTRSAPDVSTLTGALHAAVDVIDLSVTENAYRIRACVWSSAILKRSDLDAAEAVNDIVQESAQ